MGKPMVSPWYDPQLCPIRIRIAENCTGVFKGNLGIGISVNNQQGIGEVPHGFGWCRVTDSYPKKKPSIDLGQLDKRPFRETWKEEKLPGNDSLQGGIGTIGHKGLHIRVPRKDEG